MSWLKAAFMVCDSVSSQPVLFCFDSAMAFCYISKSVGSKYKITHTHAKRKYAITALAKSHCDYLLFGAWLKKINK